jgi:hypothetical protein
MALPVTARPGAFIVSLGNGASPEVFVAPCGFTQKGIRWSRALGESAIGDCLDPDGPQWLARDVQTLSLAMTGEGLLAAEDVPTWLGLLSTTDSVNVIGTITFVGVGTLTIEGAMQLESFETTAQRGQRVSASVSLQSDGAMAVAWNPVTP